MKIFEQHTKIAAIDFPLALFFHLQETEHRPGGSLASFTFPLVSREGYQQEFNLEDLFLKQFESVCN